MPPIRFALLIAAVITAGGVTIAGSAFVAGEIGLPVAAAVLCGLAASLLVRHSWR